MKRFIVYILLVALGLWIGHPYSLLTMLGIPAGVLAWGLTEYTFHRFIFHRKEDAQNRLSYNHHTHHDNPRSTEDLFLPLALTLPLSTVMYLTVAWLFGLSAASMFYTGLFIAYFWYEYIHYMAHHLRPKNRLFRALKHYHLSHHYRYGYARYGVSMPLFDWMFRT